MTMKFDPAGGYAAQPTERQAKPDVYFRFYTEFVPLDAGEGKVSYEERDAVDIVKKGSRGETTKEWIKLAMRDHELWPIMEGPYKAWKAGQEAPTQGTALEMWPVATKAQVEDFRRAGIRTVEDLADLPDAYLGAIGLGAAKLRHQARMWLESARDVGVVSQKVAEMAEEREQLLAQMAEMKATLAALSAQAAQARSDDTSVGGKGSSARA